MQETKIETTHPTEIELADFLDKACLEKEKERIETHIASCDECLERLVSAHESVRLSERSVSSTKGKVSYMKKINLYLLFAVLSFLFSFIMPRYFIQFLTATLLLGIKWIADSKSTKMLIMIYEAWKKGGEKEASRIIETLDIDSKKRF